jgi:hypothetical protein
MPDPHTAGYLSLSRSGLQPPDPLHARIPAPQPCPWIHNHWDPHYQSMPDPNSKLAEIPSSPCQAHCSSGPAEPQPHVGRLDPHTTHQALPGSSSMWSDWSSAPLGQAPSRCETATFTSLSGAPSIGQSQLQFYRLPR